MELTNNAIKVLEKRYLNRDINGNIIEKPEEMFRRVAGAIAQVDENYGIENTRELEDKFYEMMINLEFMPNSPTLMNAGKEIGQLSACFVLPVEDSMEGIFDAVKNAALIHKSGGGTGFSFSRLRPNGAMVKTTGGVASGPISFIKVFNAATEAVKQGGRRRGANMAILRVDHPDILEFIHCKENNSEITNFNISVGITEQFMKAVYENKNYNLIDPHSNKIIGELNANEIFNQIVKMAWTNGEPGIVFLDRMNKDNPTPVLGDIESTNPCGEQPLLPYESCNLGSINLSKFVLKDGNNYIIDYERLEKLIYNAVHFLDNVIDANKYPLDAIDKMTKSTRKIGLGVMGFADLLIRLSIPYNSEEAVNIAEDVMKFINTTSKRASKELAEKRAPFSAINESIYKEDLIRNATTTTIAPTGTISIISSCSSGIEPLFAISYIRNVMDNDELIEVHPVFEEIAKERGFYSKNLMESIAKHGSLEKLNVPLDIKKVFVTAHDIDPYWHIRMQAAFQKYTDNAVSKTVNFRHDATIDEVKEVFNLAYKLGCKGITIYRDGSREGQVLNIGTVNNDKKISEEDINDKLIPRDRPEITTGMTEKVRVGCGNLYITVNYDDNGICEVFTNVGRAGGCPSQSEATSRLISIALRSGMDVSEIIEQLKGIRCHSTLRQKSNNKDIKVLSCPDAIAKTIQKVLDSKIDNTQTMCDCEVSYDIDCNSCSSNINDKSKVINKPKCPECGEIISHQDGCIICPACGYSKCH